MTTQAQGSRVYEFGLKDRLRAARETSGMDQQQFADAVGISRGSVSNYETGTTAPRRPTMLAWALATGFDLQWLQTGVPSSSDDDGDGNSVTNAAATRGDSRTPHMPYALRHVA